MKTRLFFILTLIVVSSLSILPCFAQYAASTQLKKPEHYRPEFSLSTVVFSPDGRTIIGGFWNSTIYFWDVSTGEVIRKLEDCVSHNSSKAALSPDGQTFVAVFSESDDFTCVWNASTGETTYMLAASWDEGQKNQVNSIAFSPDGRMVANAIQQNPDMVGLVRVWDVSTGETIRKLEHPSGVTQVAFSPEGETLVSWGAEEGIIRFWDVSTGEVVRTIENMWTISALVFSPDGGTLAIHTGGIRLWDVSTDEVTRMLQTGAMVVALAFSPCGRTLASAHADETIHVWDVSTGKSLKTFQGHTSSSRFEDNIIGIAFNQDGGTLVSVNVQGRVLRWDTASCEPEGVPEDVNGDGVVNIQDLVAVAAALGETGETPADVNGDGQVNIQDLVAVAAAF